MDTFALFAESVETARRLARTCNPQTSKDAAEKMVKSGELNRQEKKVFEYICQLCRRYPDYMKKGFITKDVALYITEDDADDYYLWYDICRKRFSGLHDKGKIELTGDRRDGCRVWRLK